MRRIALSAAVLLVAVPAAAGGQRAAGVMTFVDSTGQRKIVTLPSSGAATKTVPAGAAGRRAELWPHVQRTALASGLDPDLIDLVIRMESGYNPRAVSPKGARGVMQLLPSTAKAYGVSNIFDPHENIRGGIRYLSDLMGRFGSDLKLALAAYNAGPEAVARHGGVPPYDETRDYVDAILAAYKGGGQKLAGGFGRTGRPAPPVELITRGDGTTISNTKRAGEPELGRTLSLR